MLVAVDNVCFDVEYEYVPAYNGGSMNDSLNVEESWPETVYLYSVALAVPINSTDLLPFLNDSTTKAIRTEILKNIHDSFHENTHIEP